MCWPSCSNLDDYYDTKVDLAPENIIQQYEGEVQGFGVSSQLEVCRNDGAKLQEHEQDRSSSNVGHASQEEVLICEESQDTDCFNNV